MARLSNTEKYAIQGMIHGGLEAKDIAKQLNRTEKVVQNYIDNELSTIQDHVVNAQIEQANDPVLDESWIGKVKKRLTVDRSNISETDIISLINKSIKIARDRNQVFDSEDSLYKACIANMRAGQYINKRTYGKRDSGVAIMNQVASQRMDEAKKSYGKAPSRSARGNVYNPSTGEIE